MHHILLSIELRSISPEAKFFLVGFVQLYGVTQPVRKGVKELAKATGATDRVVSRSVTELIDEGLFNHRTVANGRGRPKSEYQCSPRLAELLEEKHPKIASAHKERIDRVLEGARGQKKIKLNISSQRKVTINITNRLLLATLLGHADQFGVVRNLGLSDLSKRTGLNRERVKAQLHKLHILGIIRSSVPGATSSKLFGPTKSIYLLNLHHASLNQEGQTAIALALTSKTDRYLFGMCEAMWIIHAARGGVFDLTWQERQFLPNSEKFKGLATLFTPYAGNLKLIPLLQAKLEEYASILLSRHWQNLMFDERVPAQAYIDTKLLEHIREDFKSSIDTANQPTTPLSQSEVKHLLAEFLYQVAFRLACRTKKEFSIFKEILFKNNSFLIPPSPCLQLRQNLYTGSRSLLAMPQGELNEYNCYILTKNESGQLDHEYVTHEKDIPLEDRYKYGLFTKATAPKRYGQRD